MRLLALVPVATAFYLLLDLYTVINSLAALLRSFSFWLLWLVFTILNLVALLVFQKTALKVLEPVGAGPIPTDLLIVFFTTIGTFSILQSFTLRFGDYRPVDLQKMFENLRTSVLTEAAQKKLEAAKSRKLRLARQLTAFYEQNPQAIDADYERLMNFGSRPPTRITSEIAAAAANPRGKIPTLVNTMVLADEAGARNALS
jgi:hypothetical protein